MAKRYGRPVARRGMYTQLRIIHSLTRGYWSHCTFGSNPESKVTTSSLVHRTESVVASYRALLGPCSFGRQALISVVTKYQLLSNNWGNKLPLRIHTPTTSRSRNVTVKRNGCHVWEEQGKSSKSLIRRKRRGAYPSISQWWRERGYHWVKSWAFVSARKVRRKTKVGTEKFGSDCSSLQVS
jgi:hypothetical protein